MNGTGPKTVYFLFDRRGLTFKLGASSVGRPFRFRDHTLKIPSHTYYVEHLVNNPTEHSSSVSDSESKESTLHSPGPVYWRFRVHKKVPTYLRNLPK